MNLLWIIISLHYEIGIRNLIFRKFICVRANNWRCWMDGDGRPGHMPRLVKSTETKQSHLTRNWMNMRPRVGPPFNRNNVSWMEAHKMAQPISIMNNLIDCQTMNTTVRHHSRLLVRPVNENREKKINVKRRRKIVWKCVARLIDFQHWKSYTMNWWGHIDMDPRTGIVKADVCSNEQSGTWRLCVVSILKWLNWKCQQRKITTPTSPPTHAWALTATEFFMSANEDANSEKCNSGQ